MTPTPAQIEYLGYISRGNWFALCGYDIRKSLLRECMDAGWIGKNADDQLSLTPAGRAVLEEAK